MNKHKIISVRVITTVILATTLLTFSACSGQNKNSDKGTDPSAVSKINVKPPSMNIHSAAFMGNLDAINQHIEAGSLLNEKDQYGSTPLNIAITFDRKEIAVALIKAGADLKIRNNDGATPLHIAAFFCRVEIVKVLLSKNADKTLKNNFGSTALESVSSPFITVKGIYDKIGKDLGPLGLKLDNEYLKKTRPQIADMLK